MNTTRSTPKAAKPPVVRLKRTLPAPPSKVYRAWLDPRTVRRWMAPGLTATKVEVDERVGGRFSVWHADAGHDVGGFEAKILELLPDRRIVFRWAFVGPQRLAGPVYDTRLTVTFEDAPGGATMLTLLNERLDGCASDPLLAKNVEAGWEYGWAFVLEKLDSVVRRPR